MPGAANNLYNQNAAMNRNLALRSEPPQQQQQQQQQTQNDQFFSSPTSFNVYQQSKPMPPPMLQDATMNPPPFSQPPSMSPSFGMSSTQSLQNPNLASSTQNHAGLQSAWSNALFDPNDPALFNFDLASMNFGNHYGALEFGMLGHMATGAGETPPSDTHTQRGSVGTGTNFSSSVTGFSGSPGTGPFGYDSLATEWPSSQPMYSHQYRSHHDQPHAYAIETGAQSFTSPDSNASPQGMMKFEESPNMGSFGADSGRSLPGQQSRTTKPPARQPHPHISTPSLKASALPVKKSNRPRDPSHIYTTVTAPYPYTTGFHNLVSFLQKRFASSSAKQLQIAKSLASIRPSFIATTKTLNRDDLIFMEKCFQRTLWEYEGFIEGVGTPTIVARRTGEIAAVGKEFSILTGWKKEVLLGKEPNFNINSGSAAGTAPSSGANTLGSRIGGTNTPTRRGGFDSVPSDGDITPQHPQPVFLAELLDDDTVVDFYEGFARLAFGDSRGSVTGRGKLLKYKTEEDQLSNGGFDNTRSPDKTTGNKRMSSGNVKSTNGIAGEGGMEKLGFKDGKVDCTYCWTVKRDVFDIPMLIIMNVSHVPRSVSSQYLTKQQFLPCI